MFYGKWVVWPPFYSQSRSLPRELSNYGGSEVVVDPIFSIKIFHYILTL